MSASFYLDGKGMLHYSFHTRIDDMGIIYQVLDGAEAKLISLDEHHTMCSMEDNPNLTHDIETFKESNPEFYEFITESGGLTIAHYVDGYSNQKRIDQPNQP